MVKPQFELGRERVGRGVVRDPGDRREAILAVAAAARGARPAGARLRLLGAAGAEGQPRDLRLVRGRGRGGRRPRGGGRGGRRGGRASEDRGADHPLAPAGDHRGGRDRRRTWPQQAGWRLVATADEIAKHGAAAEGIETRRRAAERSRPLPRARRRRLDPPRAAPLRPHRRAGLRRQLRHRRLPRRGRARRGRGRASGAPSPARSRRSTCPASRSSSTARQQVGLNDVTFTRRPHDRVAELSYRIAGEEVGHVRCDGLVAATPAGSTGYNLANQGPILAWGVEGLRGQLHLAALADRAGAGRRPRRRPPRRQRRRPRAGRRRGRRRPGRRRWPRAPSSRSASPTTSAAWPSSRARASTSGSARSSATSPSEPTLEPRSRFSRVAAPWSASGGPSS